MRQIFKYPDEITSVKQLKPLRLNDIIKELCSYLKDNDLWSKRVNIKDFEAYLLDLHKTKLDYMLSYKISNIGLMIGSLKSVQRLYSQAVNNVRDTLSSEFQCLFENEKKFLFNQLSERLKGERRVNGLVRFLHTKILNTCKIWKINS